MNLLHTFSQSIVLNSFFRRRKNEFKLTKLVSILERAFGSDRTTDDDTERTAEVTLPS